jgi:hypothetical protein
MNASYRLPRLAVVLVPTLCHVPSQAALLVVSTQYS